MTTPLITLFAPGIPAPGGSKKAFMRPGMRFPVIVDDAKRNKEWRSVVALAARDAYHQAPLDGALAVRVVFLMPRCKGHFNAKGELKKSAPLHHTKKPDATKLFRSTEDALTGILWLDDAIIVNQNITKKYAEGETCGARIEVWRVEDVPAAPVKEPTELFNEVPHV